MSGRNRWRSCGVASRFQLFSERQRCHGERLRGGKPCPAGPGVGQSLRLRGPTPHQHKEPKLANLKEILVMWLDGESNLVTATTLGCSNCDIGKTKTIIAAQSVTMESCVR